MALNWVMVPCLDEGRDQLNKRFPKRAKLAEGGIGDKAHQMTTSSHNPDDESGVKAEYNDHDGKHEVRARDFDKNLNDDKGKTMEDVVQLWVKALRAGKMWWIRYIIYNGRIWHRHHNNFETHAYTGANKHPDHAHVNAGFGQVSDQVTGTDWLLSQLDAPKPPKPPATIPPKPPQLVVDGRLGPKTMKRLQAVLGIKQTGKLDDTTVKKIQGILRRIDPKLAIDGDFGPKTTRAFQKYLGSPVDGFLSKPVSEAVKQLQRRLNQNKF